MLAYCGNNPVMNSDATGNMHIREGGGGGGALMPGFGGGYGGGGGGGGGSYAGGSSSFWEWLKSLLFNTAIGATIGATAASGIETLRNEKFDIKAREREAAKDEVIPATPPDKQYNYWTAEIVGGVVTPIAPLTYSEARDWAAAEKNLLCINQDAALAIVRFYPHYICDGPHRKGDCRYLPHYHINNGADPETGNHRSHIWYLG